MAARGTFDRAVSCGPYGAMTFRSAEYGAMTIGLLVLIGVWSYQSDVLENEPAFGEPRYLLPLLPLFGAAVTLAVRGAGRRWARDPAIHLSPASQ